MTLESGKKIDKEAKWRIFVEDEVIATTTRTLHNLFGYKNGADAVSLYDFLRYTGKRQKTEKVKANSKYCMKGLQWGKDRFFNAKAILVEQKLVEDIPRRDEKGMIKDWYLKINYVWKKKNAEEAESILKKKEAIRKRKKSTLPQNQTVDSPESGFQTANALSANKSNALRANKKAKRSFATNGVDLFIIFAKKDTEGKITEENEKVVLSVEKFNSYIDGFYEKLLSKINPNWEQLKQNKSDRIALIRMLQNEAIGFQGVKHALWQFIYIKEDRENGENTHTYAPVVSTFIQLEKKYADLESYELKGFGQEGELWEVEVPE